MQYIGYVTKHDGNIAKLCCEARTKKEAREILIDKAHSYVWGITKVKK